ncbi:MAG: type III-A CRISPR-associated RAMP protein Csm3 [Thiotrichaceae bacterium IS1]|nr:MAG: type III-A CRISPR-associated RAMP protein Csm3 [Thiotrichaceae bacterium IS1]
MTTTPQTEEKIPAKMASKIFISGTITATTGLHIGGNSVSIAIGGVDKVVVRHPITNEPYIPGSSLRGKMRSLLERARGVEKDSGSCEGGFNWDSKKHEALAGKNPESKTAMLFGIAADDNDKDKQRKRTPTRLIVRDAHLKNKEYLEKAANLDMPLTEVKTEVFIDRITSAATPRQFERVPAGAEFGLNLILTLLEEDKDKEKEFLELVRESLELLQDDTLGGHGSRGYGQVKFSIEKVEKRTVEDYKGNPPKPAQILPIGQEVFKTFMKSA